jgi:hypothetical protein
VVPNVSANQLSCTRRRADLPTKSLADFVSLRGSRRVGSAAQRSLESQDSAVDALHRALRDVAHEIGELGRPERARRLRAPTLAAVAELKREGLSAMRVHVAIQALARNAGLRRDAGEAVDELMAWCVQAYFDREIAETAERPQYRRKAR